MKLTIKGIPKLKPGRHRDKESRGLYLQCGPTLTKSWLLRYELNGRERFMGLGAYPDFSLKEARERARAARQKLADGIDPLDERKSARLAGQLAAAKTTTFKECAEAYHAFHEGKWKSAKWAKQFTATLRDYVHPKIGNLPVADVDTGLVLKCVEPIWKEKTPTANRVRGRIQAVLDWATVRNYRAGENPARWEGHLEHILPKAGEFAKAQHQAALPFAELPAFLVELRKHEGISPRALEFLILTASRTGDVTGARWSEINLATKTWTVPAGRMKGSREHRVPLSDRALEILKALPREGDFVFLGGHKAAHIANDAINRLLKRLGYTGEQATVHGFRSTFRDWAAERTATPNHVLEQALAHTIGNKVEAAYRRGDLFQKRVRLMADWSKYCASKPVAAGDNVVEIRGTARR
jgi:integrase